MEQGIMKNLIAGDGTASGSEELQRQLSETYLTFWLENQLYGVSIAHVVQIVNVQEITQIPDFPVYAKGVINLRGIILPVIDMRLRLGKEEIPYTDKTCIIVTFYNSRNVGLLVDQIDEVTHILPEKLVAVPASIIENGETLLEGLATLPQGVAMLFDTKRLLRMEELSNIYQGEESERIGG